MNILKLINKFNKIELRYEKVAGIANRMKVSKVLINCGKKAAYEEMDLNNARISVNSYGI